MVTQTKILDTLKKARQRIVALESASREPIAIIGMACRFPGDADTPALLWDLMMAERDCISEVPVSRWDINQYYDPNPDVLGKMYVRNASFIGNIDQFDADFFNISPREANVMDPQQRLLLEVSWEALETSAQSLQQIRDQSTGIFIGVSRHEYANVAYGLDPTALDAYAGLGNFQSVAAGRLAYWLGTRGPVMTLDTACSSSLVAIHQACQSLRTKDCDLALAGGISLMLSPLGTIFGCKMKALSVDGYCRSFDQKANGYGRGEGVGIVILKRLSDAISDRDHILAVIPGSAVNHDGRSSGLTVPNGQAQRQLLKNALRNAGIDSQSVTYIEAHATGTALGDPIEVNAILDVYSSADRLRSLFLGSIKPNIGHLESAAGVASLIKVILMIQHKKIPKQIHFHQLNPHIDDRQSWLVIPKASMAWQEKQYFAGVSSFGLSGTNAHIILTESPNTSREKFSPPALYLLPLSAKNESALEELTRHYLNYFNDPLNINAMADICYTAAIGRSHFPVRVAFTANSREEMLENIKAWLHNKSIKQAIGKFDLIANAYMKGDMIDWNEIYQDPFFIRVNLPTYPFQKQRYWVEEDHSKSQNYFPRLKAHPLLGKHISSPLSSWQFSAEVNLSFPQYRFLRDHQIDGKIIFPGAGFIEMILMAVSIASKNKKIILQDINIKKPLFLHKEGEQLLYTLLEPSETDFTIKIFSSQKSKTKPTEWLEHVSARAKNFNNIDNNGFCEFVSDSFHEINVEKIQEILFKSNVLSGLFYGPNFQNIQKVFSDSQGRIMGEIEVVPEKFGDLNEYYFHPALLDACLRVGQFALPEHEQGMTFLPVSVHSLKIYKPPGIKLRSYAVLRNAASNGLKSFDIDFFICDENNEIILEIVGLKLKKISPEKLENKISKLIYKTEWVLSPLKKYEILPKNKFYIIFGNNDEITCSITFFLKQNGYRYILIYPDESYSILDEYTIKINCKDERDYFNLIEKYLLSNQANIGGILHLWSLNSHPSTTSSSSLLRDLSLSCETALYLIQALVKIPIDHQFPILFITLLANWVNKAPTTWVNPQQAALWGLIKVANLEHPHLKCVGIDLDLGKPVKEQACRILDECQLYSQSGENRIAYRDNQRYLEKLFLFKGKASEINYRNMPFQLRYSPGGIISEMEFHQVSIAALDSEEVMVEVAVIGLNFKDVLMALNAFQVMNHGFELSGKVIQIGQNVKNLRIGDHVMGFAPRQGIGNFAKVNEKYMVKKPASINLEEAATLPIAFITAQYALFDCGKIKAGDRILIHSAAGGVGLAAVQLAQQAGAEIFATAHPDKWPFLRAIGIKNVMSSRTLDYADEIKRLTEGEGVTMVLNSLKGEYIPKNINIIKKNGILVEIGKRGIWTVEQVQTYRADIHYHVFDLTTIMNDHPDFVAEKLNMVKKHVESGLIKPLFFKKFPINEVKTAFKYMAQAKHIGKVIIDMFDHQERCFLHSAKLLNSEGAYLITGGFGDLGQLVAHFLIKKGVRHLILIGRNLEPEKRSELINNLKNAGAHTVRIFLINIANLEELTKIFQQLANENTSLRGIVHAAGIIDDALLTKMNWEKFLTVFQAKVLGTWNLHQLSLQHPLDFFVCFSSLTAILGAYGQANYAAANAFMDACMHQRLLRGLPGLTINWGPWDEKGMAANMSLPNQQRLVRQGLNKLKPDVALAAFDFMLGYVREHSQFSVCSVYWDKYCQELSNPYILSYVERVIKTIQQDDERNFTLQPLSELTITKKRIFILERLRMRLAKIIEVSDFEKINLDTVFADLGVDSLMAIEFAHLIEVDFQCKITFNLFFEFPTMALLIDYLLEQINVSSALDSSVVS